MTRAIASVVIHRQAAIPTAIRPTGYSGTRAYLQAAEVARHGVSALIEAFERALAQLEEQSDYEDLVVEVEDLKKDLKEANEKHSELETERDALKAQIDKLAEEDERVKDAEAAREQARVAENEANHWREMYGRIEKERLDGHKRAQEAQGKLRELQDAFREIVGDDSSALLMATYWHTRAQAHESELMQLRKRVAELEAPSARSRSTKQLQADVEYWKRKALEK